MSKRRSAASWQRFPTGLPRPLVILDEITAGLDEETEKAVLAALDDFSRRRTLILASHRPALIAWADHIIDIGGDAE